MIIIGAGMAGLLASNILRSKRPQVIEAQPQLPNNHSAVLRFRSSVVGDVLGIPFKRVKLIKATLPFRNSVAEALAYSYKNSGIYLSDRSITNGSVQSEDRFIAPPDLISRMAEGQDITFSTTIDRFVPGETYISTMPMPALMALLDYPHAKEAQFNSTPAVNIRATILNCEAYVSLMVPDPKYPFSRISVTGDELIVECPNKRRDNLDISNIASDALQLLGIDNGMRDVNANESRYAKITPIDERIRRDFLHWATDKFNIFSLGRFACWRSGLLLDDLVSDVRKIEGWIDNRYEMRKAR